MQDDSTLAPETKPNSIARSVAQRLRRWWLAQDPDERYLAAATDLADLERRMRIVERAKFGPAFVTFNH